MELFDKITGESLDIKYNPDFDTKESIKARVANKIKTLPQLISWEEKGNTLAFSALSSLYKDISYIDKNRLDELFGEYKSMIKNKEIKTENRQFLFYLIYYSKLFKISDKKWIFNYNEAKGDKKGEILANSIAIDEFIKEQNEGKKNIFSFSNLETFDNEFNIFKKKMQDEEEILSKNIKLAEKAFNEIEKIEPLSSTNIKVTHTILETTFDIGIDIYELFNNIVPSRNVPFIFIGKFYKILKDFNPPVEWTQNPSEYSPDKLYLYVLNVNTEPPGVSSKYYSLAEMEAKHKENEVNTVYLSIESKIGDELKEKDLLDRIETSLGLGKIQYLSSEQKKIKGIFQIPEINLYEVIMRELAMNDPIFSTFLSIDESRQIQKKKENVYMYFGFNPFVSESISLSLNEHMVKHDDYDLQDYVINRDGEIKDQDEEKASDRPFKFGTYYIETKITKASTESDALKFLNIFLRLINHYTIQQNSIIKEYSKFIDDFKERYIKERKDDKKSYSRKKWLKDYAPKIFFSDYTRQCSAKREPIIVDKKEAETKLSYMRFPKTPEEDKQRYYICPTKEYKYIGLIDNAQRNQEQFKYVPCCFSKDQSNKRRWKEYFEGKVEKKKTSSLYLLTIHTKILDSHTKRGVLAPDVESLLFTLDPDVYKKGSLVTYGRRGVEKSPNSAIEAVMSALDSKFYSTDYKQRILDVRNQILSDLGKKITRSHSEVYQNSYRYTYSSLKEILKNPNTYFNPRIFIRDLERILKCNIFIFSMDSLNPDGYLAAPEFTQEYLQYSADRKEYPYVFLFENINIVKQNIKTVGRKRERKSNIVDRIKRDPHCEIIFKGISRSQEEVKFDGSQKLIKRLIKVFRELYVSQRIVGGELTFTDEITLDLKNVVGQGIDYFGKTRFLQFNTNEGEICILTNPLPTLPIPVKYDYKPVDIKVAESFLREQKIDEYQPVKIDNNLVGLSGSKGNTHFYIPLSEIKSSLDLSTIETLQSPILRDITVMGKYNILKRFSRYYREYTYYLFSLYLHKNKIKNISEDTIVDFAKESFIEGKVNIETQIPRLFTLESPLLENGKLIVPSEETIKRLIYCLRLELNNSKNNVINYRLNKYIVNYYVDIDDFTDSQDFVILSGKLALDHWINNKSLNYGTVSNIKKVDTKIVKDEEEEILTPVDIDRILTIRHVKTNPYLFKNDVLNEGIDKIKVEVEEKKEIVLNGRRYLVQPVLTKYHAIDVITTWYRNRYNKGNSHQRVENPHEKIKLITEPAEDLNQYIQYYDLYVQLKGAIEFKSVPDVEDSERELERFMNDILENPPEVHSFTEVIYNDSDSMEIIDGGTKDYIVLYYGINEPIQKIFVQALLPIDL